MVYNHTGCDITGYFRLPVIEVEKTVEMWPSTVSVGIYRDLFAPRPPKFTCLSGTVDLTDLPDMTSLAVSGRLQNATKYCTKLLKTGAAGRVD